VIPIKLSLYCSYTYDFIYIGNIHVYIHVRACVCVRACACVRACVYTHIYTGCIKFKNLESGYLEIGKIIYFINLRTVIFSIEVIFSTSDSLRKWAIKTWYFYGFGFYVKKI